MKANKILYRALDIMLMLISAVLIAATAELPVLAVFSALATLYLVTYICVTWFGAVPMRGSLFATVAYACTEAIGTSTAVYTDAGDCLEEGTGILGFFLVKKGFDLPTIIDATTYTAAKTAFNIVPVKDIEGYWPKTNPVTVAGLAGRMPRLGHIEYEFTYKHEGVDANLHFHNTLNNSRNWGIAFVTEEYKVFAPLDRDLEPVLCQFFATPEGEQEFGKVRVFQGSVKWKHRDLPQLIEALGFVKAQIKPDFQP
jgi:hypothetical protein